MHSMNTFVIQRSAPRPWNLLLMTPTRRTVTRHQMEMGLLYISSRCHFTARGSYQSLQSLSQTPFGSQPVWTLQNLMSSTLLRPRQLDLPRHANESTTSRVCSRGSENANIFESKLLFPRCFRSFATLATTRFIPIVLKRSVNHTTYDQSRIRT